MPSEVCKLTEESFHAFLLALIIHRGLSMLDIFPATTTKDPEGPLENKSGVQGQKC